MGVIIFLVISFAISLISLGLIAASQATTYWIVEFNLKIGLYQICDNNNCISLDWDPTELDLEVFVTRIVLLVADIFVVIGFIITLISFCIEIKKRLLTAAGSVNILASFIIFGGSIAFTVIEIFQSNHSTSYNFSYGFCWTAGVLFLIAGILQLIGASKEQIISVETISITRLNKKKIALQSPAENPHYIPDDMTAPSPTAPPLV